jgi:hypothetical protein
MDGIREPLYDLSLSNQVNLRILRPNRTKNVLRTTIYTKKRCLFGRYRLIYSLLAGFKRSARQEEVVRCTTALASPVFIRAIRAALVSLRNPDPSLTFLHLPAA